MLLVKSIEHELEQSAEELHLIQLGLMTPHGVKQHGQRTMSSVVQVMSCRQFGAKTLPEPMLNYRPLYHQQQSLVKVKST